MGSYVRQCLYIFTDFLILVPVSIFIIGTVCISLTDKVNVTQLDPESGNNEKIMINAIVMVINSGNHFVSIWSNLRATWFDLLPTLRNTL